MSSIDFSYKTKYYLLDDTLYVVGRLTDGRHITAVWSVYQVSDSKYTVLSMRPTTYVGVLQAEGAKRVAVDESTDEQMMYGTQLTLRPLA